MNSVETVENWMNTFDEDHVNDMDINATQGLPSFVEYTPNKPRDLFARPINNDSLLTGDIISRPMCNNMLYPIDFSNTGSLNIMDGYHTGVFNSLTDPPLTRQLPAFKIPTKGGSKRQPRKTPLSADKVYANVPSERCQEPRQEGDVDE